MKLKQVMGEGLQGLTLNLDIFEMQELANVVASIDELNDPRISGFEAKLSRHHEKNAKNSPDDTIAEQTRLDELLVDTLIKCESFLAKLSKDTPSTDKVFNELFGPSLGKGFQKM
jgi:hypothetical protein